MNLKNLTPTQKSLVEDIVNEFNKANECISTSGLINVAAIIGEDVKTVNEIKRIELSNKSKSQLLRDTITKYCNILNPDLAKLGLKAELFSGAISTSTLVIGALNDSINNKADCIRIDSKAVKSNVHSGEIVDFMLVFGKKEYSTFEEIFESECFKNRLLKAYSEKGKRALK